MKATMSSVMSNLLEKIGSLPVYFYPSDGHAMSGAFYAWLCEEDFQALGQANAEIVVYRWLERFDPYDSLPLTTLEQKHDSVDSSSVGEGYHGMSTIPERLSSAMTLDSDVNRSSARWSDAVRTDTRWSEASAVEANPRDVSYRSASFVTAIPESAGTESVDFTRQDSSRSV